MTQDEIIRMAREAGFLVDNALFRESVSLFERFFNLAFAAGAAHEREACAKVCEQQDKSEYPRTFIDECFFNGHRSMRRSHPNKG